MKPRATRSAVTNGRRLFQKTPKDLGRLRRFRDLLDEVAAPIGGFEGLTEPRKQTVRRVAAIALVLEDAEADLVGGAALDHEAFARASQTQHRLMVSLGLVPREAPPVDDDEEHKGHQWVLENLCAADLRVLHALAVKAQAPQVAEGHPVGEKLSQLIERKTQYETAK